MTAPTDPLPIDNVLAALADALAAGTRCVLVAPPGAGKTTRVPLALLDSDWRGEGRIVVLEPRRLAARAAAHRMAATLGEPVGKTVGYRVRLDTKVSARTRIEVVTEGVFTRMILHDPELTGVAAVLFDEFHERSLDGDLGLALALDATALRADLRLLVMSATIDGARVSTLLGDAPVIESEGRAFDVETRHIAPTPEERLEDTVMRASLRALDEEPGSALVFLPGQAEIRRVAERLAGKLGTGIDIAPLYGRLTTAEQDAAIQPAPEGRRKIVLATTIAQTSLTIEGIRIVIDSGFARLPVYEPGMGLTRLETRRISRAAADQRRGRAGRTEPGVCYRLWHTGQTGGFPAYDRPEIMQADLAPFALDLAQWGVTDPARLTFPDSPPAPAWAEAVSLLKTLGALDESGLITAHGKALADLPLHPRLGHMVAMAAREGAAEEAARIAALVSEPGLGGQAVDLSVRLQSFARDKSQRSRDARALAKRWAKPFPGATAPSRASNPGRHLARAFPDRVAQSVSDRGTFRLANGRQAKIEQTDSLARAPFIVVADMTGHAARAIVRSAAEIAPDAVEELVARDIEARTTLVFDTQAKAVRARETRMLGALRLADAPAKVTDPEAAARILAEGVARLGIGTLPWTREQKSLRARSTYLFGMIGEGWADLSDTALAQDDASWLVPRIHGLTRASEITAEHLSAALFALLPWDKRKDMDRLLPSHFDAPSGSRIPIDYDAESGPVLAARPQELFGLDKHPAIADGRISLLVELLSPARRPIQTTRDLPGFWRGSWREVAKDMRGRYPKHFWPDDPRAAEPTNKAKPRKG